MGGGRFCIYIYILGVFLNHFNVLYIYIYIYYFNLLKGRIEYLIVKWYINFFFKVDFCS